MLLQTDGANPTPYTRPGKIWEVRGRRPEEGEDLRTGWVTVGGKKECQVETETEEMETPQARRMLDPLPSLPPRVPEWSKCWWEAGNKSEEEERCVGWSQRWRSEFYF